MSKLRNLLLGAGMAAIVLGAGEEAKAQENCGAALNYEEADIRAVIDEIAIRTGRTFLLDPTVQGRVTVKSPPNGGLCADEAWELFQAMLRVNDFVATPAGDGKYRIVPLQEAARAAGQVGEGRGSDFVTQIVRLNYVDAREAAANLAQIVGQNGVVSPVRTGNSIIVVDTADNVARIQQVLRQLDRDSTIFRTISLEHASASDIARLVRDLGAELSEEGNGRPSAFSVVPVDASNSLLIRAEPTLMRRLEMVIAELDRYGEESSDLTVVYLKHASAEELAPLLTEVANNAAPAGQGEVQATRNRATVSFHGPTNAVIINGDANIQRTLQNVIEKLDVRRPQVLVEAIIVEISDTAARALGVQYFLTGDKIPFSATNWSGAPNIFPAAGAALLEGSRFNNVFETTSTVVVDDGVTTNSTTEGLQSQLATQALQSLLGVQGLLVGGGFEFGEGNFFGGILTALKNDSDSNVLSTPSVLTLNNQTARLQVGQEIPITTGEAIGDNFQNAFRTINREQVGVILEVTPQINDGDTVTMEIVQEISSIVGPISSTSTDLITNKREITTTALVDNGEILVIGGLIDDQTEERQEKVPLLGDIPGVGNLFRSSSRERRRQNLMVFIRPTIIRDQATANSATKRKMDYMRARELLRSGQPVSEIERLIDDVTGAAEPQAQPQ
ncbi:type II secretion system secretin GspD [Hyphococcus flavus]|uniref:Type II secretion system secretin GspD n=1 Tax=Hyphococcus flavus TaxID=1866326 RepID=A0AAE9ZI12_9PROT|nr:type II secretion system secretin GspD [Hyphococcus flavus]WDI31251.1 type II secretion system secretin GspD [Hyphococcus flavus]